MIEEEEEDVFLGLPSGLFPSGFPTKTLFAFLSSLLLATGPTFITFLNLITQTLFGKQYKSGSTTSFILL